MVANITIVIPTIKKLRHSVKFADLRFAKCEFIRNPIWFLAFLRHPGNGAFVFKCAVIRDPICFFSSFRNARSAYPKSSVLIRKYETLSSKRALRQHVHQTSALFFSFSPTGPAFARSFGEVLHLVTP